MSADDLDFSDDDFPDDETISESDAAQPSDNSPLAEALSRVDEAGIRERMLQSAHRLRVSDDDEIWALFALAAESAGVTAAAIREMKAAAVHIENFTGDMAAVSEKAGQQAGAVAGRALESLLADQAGAAGKQVREAYVRSAAGMATAIEGHAEKFRETLDLISEDEAKRWHQTAKRDLQKFVKSQVSKSRAKGAILTLGALVISLVVLIIGGLYSGYVIPPSAGLRFDAGQGVVYATGEVHIQKGCGSYSTKSSQWRGCIAVRPVDLPGAQVLGVIPRSH